jgi:hypothetical protein
VDRPSFLVALTAVAAACAAGAAVIPLDESNVPRDFSVLFGGGSFSGSPGEEVELVVEGHMLVVAPPAGYVVAGWGSDDDAATVILIPEGASGAEPIDGISIRVVSATSVGGSSISTREGRPVVVLDGALGRAAVAWEVFEGTWVIAGSAAADTALLLAVLDGVRVES